MMIKRKHGLVIAFAIAGMAVSAPAHAQVGRWSLEGRLGATLPTARLSNTGVESGLSAEAEALYTFTPDASFIMGVGMHSFDCPNRSVCDDISSSGFHAGLKFLFPHSGTATPWLRGGLLVHSADVGRDNSGTALGFEAGGGIDLALSPHFSLAPSLRYLHYNADFGSSDLTMSWFDIALGAHLHM